MRREVRRRGERRGKRGKRGQRGEETGGVRGEVRTSQTDRLRETLYLIIQQTL